MKIQFDIKYRPQIESGEYKIVTRDWSPVRIICWDANIGQPIVGLVYDSDEECETIEMFFDNGRYWQSGKESPFDLFIITPDPELTEFEKGIKRGFLCAGLEDVPTGIIKDTAKELLELAKKDMKEQMMKEAVEGYVTLTLTGALTVAATIKEGDNIGISDKVRIIIVKEEG